MNEVYINSGFQTKQSLKDHFLKICEKPWRQCTLIKEEHVTKVWQSFVYWAED